MKRFCVFVVLAIVLIGFCTAQSANNDAQRIVGTWTDNNSRTWVFNVNGTGTYNGDNFNYWISVGGEIITSISLWRKDGSNYSSGTLYFSPDGRRMRINNTIYQKN